MNVVIPRVASMVNATEMQAALAASEIRLFKSDFTPNTLSVLADFQTAQANFSGYTAGGEEIAAWTDPLYDPDGGVSIQSGLVQFAVATAIPIVPNTIGGWYLVDSGGALRAYGVFEEPVILGAVGDGIPLNVLLRF